MSTPVNHTNRKSAFTLVELLVVITIIGILAGLVLQIAGFAQKKAARSRAEAEIAALSAALESYKADMGDYPANSNTTNNSILRAALAPTSGKIYFEFTKTMGTNNQLANDTNESVYDPFRSVYGYTYPGNSTRSGTNNFDLWSTCGSPNTNQWIKNW